MTTRLSTAPGWYIFRSKPVSSDITFLALLQLDVQLSITRYSILSISSSVGHYLFVTVPVFVLTMTPGVSTQTRWIILPVNCSILVVPGSDTLLSLRLAQSFEFLPPPCSSMSGFQENDSFACLE